MKWRKLTSDDFFYYGGMTLLIGMFIYSIVEYVLR